MPTSKNFIVSPAVTIRQIRENLREGRYSQAEGIFGIIKELVQNAEDAKAGQLLIAWTAELPGASHPLLQGPGLLAVNDGHFRAEDGRAIRRFGLNSKAADAASIGKFGLGLKSVFHLAEVFFFTAVNERGKVLDADVLNPWSDEAGGLHPDWDDWPAADQDRMQSFVRSFGSGGRRFCLWIPLRRRGRLGAVEPITRNFPGDLAVNSLFAGDMPGRLARLLPMLRHLREISVWVVSPDGPTRSFLVKVGDDSSRRTDMKELERLQANSPRSFAGQAIVTGTASDQRFVYSGRELRYDDPGLHALENAEFWPQDIAMDEETGEEVHVREKARPHAAVCFAATRTSSANPRLAVNWSMFLPLSEPAVISLAQSGWSVDVFLHGYFFVDAGRNQIEGINAAFPGSIQDSSGLRRAWNQGLARRGTLPLLPLAMSDVTDKAGWDDDMVANLTRQLAASSLFQEYAPDICRDWIWLRRLTPDATSRWQIAPASQPLHVLPGAAGDRSLAFAVFPSLQQATADTLIGFRDDPRLTAKPLEPWPDDLVTRLLESAVPEAVFASRDCIQYLSRFLEQCDRSDPRTEARPSRGAKTAHLLRRGLSALGRPIPVTLAGPLGEFVRRIPPAHRVCFKPSQIDSNRELFAWLCDQEVDIAWIPEELEPTDSPSAGRIGVDQCTRILEGLANWGQREQGSEEREARAEVAAQLHRACNDTNGLMSRCGNLKLFTGRNCRLGREVLLSWKEIAEHQQRQTLFTKPSPLAKQLQDGLADDTILLVTKELYLLLFGGDKAPACREAQLLATLASQPRPRLAPPEHRRQLLTTLLRYQGGRDDPQYARCVRYLLHGQVQHFETTTPLLVRPEHRDIWSRMAEVALARLDQAWCLLDASFAGALRGDEYGEFGVTVVDHDVAIARALPVDPAQFACLEPNESEYRLLLRHIEDTEFTSRLPIHQDCAGRFVGIDAHSFWESGLSLPAVLENKVRILRRSRDEATWKRQQQLAPVLDEMVVLDIVLQEPSPGKCWQVILDCLVAIDHVPLTLVTRLRSAAWLPTTSETFVKPEDVIHLPEFSDDVSRLSADYQGVFVDPARLNPQVREPSTFRRLAALAFPARDEALAMLGTLLVDDDRNRVGDVVDVSLDDWLDAFRGAPAELCPAYDLLRRLKERFATAAASTFAELCRPFSEQRGRELLDFLRDAHEKERGVMRKQKIAKVFAQYLRTRVTRERFCEQLSGENLLAADGSWRPAEALCCSNDGVARQAVLDPLLEQALANRFPESVAKGGTSAADLATRGGRSQEPKREDVERAIQATAERLREYFDPWRDVIPNEQIGGFLALLGDDPGVRQLAQSFLGHNRALEETRANFEMPELCSGTYIEDRVVVQLVREATVRVLNLFGQPIEVPRDERPSTLFVGYGARADQFPRKIVDRLRICAFRLNVINPRHFAEAELSRLLRDSAIKFMSASYGRDYQQTRFAATWEELSASDQLDIAITQSRIVEHGFLILDQYGLRVDPQLARVLDRWDSAERLKAERELQVQTTRRGSGRHPDTELQVARQELRQLLEENADTQHHVLSAVRRRIADHYQYTTDSIPFELFQNADDAYNELRCFFPCDPEREHDSSSFVICSRDDAVVFVHFGRRINQYPIDDLSSSKGFDNDLWKMSVLSLSNKGQAGDTGDLAVTGKFGLGFKSVFLACDRPRLLSGRLAFEFVGGIYPRRLIGDERHSLDEIRDHVAGGENQATIVELPLAASTSPEAVLDRLRRLAHVLVVFARQIRRCVWYGESPEVRWEPEDVPEVVGCQVGILSPSVMTAGQDSVTRGLVFQSEAGAVLLGLGAREFKAFSADVPTIWVTAPTQELLDLGFLVNGPFALDVGRAQLARDHQQNERPASDLGQSFGAQLDQLYAATSSTRWIGTRKAMGLAADADPYSLWDSLWDLLAIRVDERARHDEPAARLIRAILWNADDRGAASFYAKHRSVPARLPNDDRPLVSLRDVRWAVRGVLANDRDAFAIAHRWPSFGERVSTGTLVSETEVVLPTRRLCPSLVENVRSIGLPEVLEWELDHSMVDPEKASRLGGVVDKKFLERLRDLAERNRLRSLLDGAEFLACDERYHPARQLLIGHSTSLSQLVHDDESFRAEFAPKDRVLNPKYGRAGVAFFEACRERMEANVRLMAEWITSAASEPAKRAALTYLADGELGRELQLELVKQGLAGTWLDNVLHSPTYATLTAGQKHRLVDIVPIALPLSPPSPITSPPVSAERVLRDIHKWWTAERAQRLGDYEARTYPNGRLIHLADDNIENDAQRRKQWLTLFLLGLTHTMGRTVAKQHRGFLCDCERGGWLNVFACSERDPAQWMKFIDDYLRDKLDETKFLQWMKQFVGIYQISRYLDDYIEAFQAVPRIRRPFSLAEVTNTRTSAAFQRGGVSAPPLSRVLGIGACFVLRELSRLEVIENEHANRHCYPPVGRVRKLLQELGCEGLDVVTRRWELSPVIHRFLELHLGKNAIFHRDFDIPLQIVAEDVDLQDRFLRTRIDDDDEVDEWLTDDDGIPSSED